MNEVLGREIEAPKVARGNGLRALIGRTGHQREAHFTSPARYANGQYPALPSYLRDIYGWAYLDPRNARLLDHEAVVNTLLWGNSGRLRRALLAEITPGDRVLQAAHVYGRLIPDLAKTVGPAGRFDIIEIAPLQAAMCRRKLRDFPSAHVRIGDAACPGDGEYDVVVSFFLLHELPDDGYLIEVAAEHATELHDVLDDIINEQQSFDEELDHSERITGSAKRIGLIALIAIVIILAILGVIEL